MPTALPTTDPTASDRQTRLDELLNRPADQRLREYKYRFAQSIVFGLPVIVLQYWGTSLGPVDHDRWVSLIQSLMCGWVLYVNAGMLFEGILIPRLRLRGDFLIAILASLLYVVSIVSALHGILTARLWYPLQYHWCVILLGVWSGFRWFRLSRA
jgi:hypothetical protein